MKARRTLYDILELPPTASEGDIHVAHIRLVRYFQYGPHGLSAAEADHQIRLVKEAWWTLSDAGRRAAYEAGLRAAEPADAAAGPELPLPMPELEEDKALPLKVEIKSRSTILMLKVIGGLVIVGMLIQIGYSLFAIKQVSRISSGEAAAEAQERVMAEERRMTYGTPLSAEEAAALQAAEEKKREEQRQQEAERRQEAARREEEHNRERALMERKYYADQISRDLQHGEENARIQQEREKAAQEERRRREELEEQRAINERVARERQRWQQELQR